ncbi:NAD-dependent epimerase/dehydratase family protein [Mesorhizobium sp. Z1-4]|uniref:NAD-dependent epimerase/dehydratase family protein n=1 Tax=Mesorhizobium sp. Z1-4 TaxID=2448478 RepID=UPI000FD849C7|nr:NAD-dependent epimerase/dehydratase family protein [Mesorhizobium sp. Z1-4]
MRWLMIGAGYSAQTLARLIAGEAAAVSGTTRDTVKFGALEASGISPLEFDGSSIPQALAQEMSRATHLLHSAAPGSGSDPLLTLLGASLAEAMPKLRWAGYLSTVGVYGNHDGNWVDEESACLATSKRGIARVQAERQWLDVGKASGITVAVLRLAGIYGPGRNAFTKLEDGTAHRIVKQGQLFSRIHVADIAAATRHLAESGVGGIFNLADNEPAPPQDVIAYAAELMGVEPPPEIPFEEAEMSPMARSFYADSRRVSNARLNASGYELKYPDYRTALSAMWREGSWR